MSSMSDGFQRAVDVAKSCTPGAMEKVRSAAQTVADKAQQFADTVAQESYEADFTVIEDEDSGTEPKQEQPHDILTNESAETRTDTENPAIEPIEIKKD